MQIEPYDLIKYTQERLQEQIEKENWKGICFYQEVLERYKSERYLLFATALFNYLQEGEDDEHRDQQYRL